MNTFRYALPLVLASVLFSACATVPYTQRRQFVLVSEEQELQLGQQAFAEVKQKEPISKDPEATALVTRVGKRIAAVSERPEFEWEFATIAEPKTANAFALPGGKVAVYTGLLPVAKDETGLAVVMAHEVAHVLARHGAERMSEQMAAGLALDLALAGKSPQVMQAVQLAYGVGRGLPHSRKQESEADRIGLILMAKAGYDPRQAPEFWQRMAASHQGSGPPEFLSTHPSDETRIKNLQEQIPEAMKHYQPR